MQGRVWGATGQWKRDGVVAGIDLRLVRVFS